MSLRKRATEIGEHIIIDFCRCDKNIISDNKKIVDITDDIVTEMGLTVMDRLVREFDGQGMTICLVLSESHLIVHTWPEFGCLSLDIFTCGKSRVLDIEKVALRLLSKKVRKKHIRHDK